MKQLQLAVLATSILIPGILFSADKQFGAKYFLGGCPKVRLQTGVVNGAQYCLGDLPADVAVIIFNDKNLDNNTRLALRAVNKAWKRAFIIDIERVGQNGVLCDLTMVQYQKPRSWKEFAWEFPQSVWTQPSVESVLKFKDENMEIFTNLICESKSQIGGIFEIKSYDKRGFDRVIDILMFQEYVEVRKKSDRQAIIGDGAIESLTNSLKHSTNLKFLNLDAVVLSKGDIESIVDLLGTRKSLTDMRLNQAV